MNHSLNFLFKRFFQEGDNPERVKQKICQDIFISKLIDSTLWSHKIVFKGGIVMYELTKGKRGYTKDIDIDFIQYPITEIAIKDFILQINQSLQFENILVNLNHTEELNLKNYKGRRAFLDFIDNDKSNFKLSIDIGVHTDTITKPLSYSYKNRMQTESIEIMIDSNELSIVEKLSTLAMYGINNKRYRDIFDAYWRLKYLDYDIKAIAEIFDRKVVFTGYFKNRAIAVGTIIKTLKDKTYISQIKKEKNWTDETVENICQYLINFLDKYL